MSAQPRTSAADLMTLANGVCGFLALAVLADLWVQPGPLDDDQLRVCLLLYGIGMVFDVLDGPVARRFGSSGLGPTLDTICDTISFGLLPALLLVASLQDDSAWRGFALIAAAAYVAGTILRLARHAKHEVDDASAGREHVRGAFSGMPSPVGGNCVLAVVVLTPAAPVAAAVVLAVAYFLVADIAYPNNTRFGGVYVAALLAASFAALAGLIPLEVPAAAALIGLLPIAILRVSMAGVVAVRHLLHPVALDPHVDR